MLRFGAGEGRVADALEAYTTPLLSRSDVLALQLLRDQLVITVGAAVRSSEDAGCVSGGRLRTRALSALGRWKRWADWCVAGCAVIGVCARWPGSGSCLRRGLS